jgi:hypothetical protein
MIAALGAAVVTAGAEPSSLEIAADSRLPVERICL